MDAIARRLLAALAGLCLAALLAVAPATTGAPAAQPRPSGHTVLVLLQPERLASVDLATGEVREQQLPGGTLCRSRVHVVGDRIVYLVPGRRFGRVMSVDVPLREEPRFVAHADFMVPATEPGRLWLGLRTDRDRMRVRTLWLASRFQHRARRTAPLRPLLGAVPERLVLQGRTTTFVWDPRTGRRSRATPGAFVLATAQSRIVSCGGDCATLLVADGRRGRVVHGPRGAAFLPSPGAVSPGGLVAVAVQAVGSPRVALVDLRTAESRFVPELRLAGSAPLAWAPSGERLYAVAPEGRIVSYTPGAQAPLPVGRTFADPVVQLLVAG